MNRTDTKLSTLRQLRELVQADIDKVGPVMDDYDGGQMAAYEKVLTSIRMFESIVLHTTSRSGKFSQEDPGIDC